jgi:hypothetical protein
MVSERSVVKSEWTILSCFVGGNLFLGQKPWEEMEKKYVQTAPGRYISQRGKEKGILASLSRDGGETPEFPHAAVKKVSESVRPYREMRGDILYQNRGI